jgi:hypothetical protein
MSEPVVVEPVKVPRKPTRAKVKAAPKVAPTPEQKRPTYNHDTGAFE